MVAISLPSPALATSAEVVDSLANTPVLPQAPQVAAVITPFIVVSTIVGGGNVVEPWVMPAYSHACLIFSFESTYSLSRVLWL